MDIKFIASLSSHWSLHRLKHIGNEQLRVCSTKTVRKVAVAFGIAALGILLGTGWQGIVYFALFALIGLSLWFFPSQATFDRSRGRLAFRRFVTVRHFDFRGIAAVRVIDGGWHYPRRSVAYRSKKLAIALNDEEQTLLTVTNHGEDALTDWMAAEISKFVEVPLIDETSPAGIASQPKTRPIDAADLKSPPTTGRWALHEVCFWAAIACGSFSIVIGLYQPQLARLAEEARPVRARLIATEVKEWTPGNGNWAARGDFEILFGPHQGRALGTLNPANETGSRRRNITRTQAERFARNWEIGKIYDGFVYPEYSDKIFFELPAIENGRLLWFFRIAALSLALLGVVLFAFQRALAAVQAGVQSV
jgi:hypothetical protein